MANIHPTAIVDPGAHLGQSVTIGAFTVVGPHVRIDEGTMVGPHCVIEGHTTIGRDNRIYQFASLGAAPQDKKYAGEPTELRIGDRNTIREFTTFNTGTVQDDGVTQLGDDNWMMAYTHLAHDCKVGNKTIFANNAQIAGHVHVGDWVILGGYTQVHQFVKIGAHAMTGMGTTLLQDVPPFAMISGNPAEARSFNLEGLKRRGFSPERVKAIKQMHKLLYRQGLGLDEAKAAIQALAQEAPEAAADVALMTGFLASATRGIVR
jgi:UDP-N-acetylglucosamine acyltransferase